MIGLSYFYLSDAIFCLYIFIYFIADITHFYIFINAISLYKKMIIFLFTISYIFLNSIRNHNLKSRIIELLLISMFIDT